MSKADFLSELLAYPSGLSSAVVGQVVDIGNPNSVDAAIIASGVLAYNINEAILKPLQGVDLVELILYAGGRNPNLVSMVLASLESLGVADSDSSGFSVVSPVAGRVYPPFFDDAFRITGKGISSASANLGSESFSLASGSDGVFSAGLRVPLVTGDHSVVFKVAFSDGSEKSKTVLFSVAGSSLQTVPAQGQQVSAASAPPVSVSGVDSDVQSVSVSMLDRIFQLKREADGYFQMLWPDFAVDIYTGSQEAVFKLIKSTGETIETVVNFTLGD